MPRAKIRIEGPQSIGKSTVIHVLYHKYSSTLKIIEEGEGYEIWEYTYPDSTQPGFPDCPVKKFNVIKLGL